MPCRVRSTHLIILRRLHARLTVSWHVALQSTRQPRRDGRNSLSKPQERRLPRGTCGNMYLPSLATVTMPLLLRLPGERPNQCARILGEPRRRRAQAGCPARGPTRTRTRYLAPNPRERDATGRVSG